MKNKPSYLGMLSLAMLLDSILVFAVNWRLPENFWEIVFGLIIICFGIALGEIYGNSRNQ